MKHQDAANLNQQFQTPEGELIMRIRQNVKGHNLQDILKTFTRDNKDEIKEDELILGLSKVNANLYLSDIRDFATYVKNKGSLAKKDGIETSDKISISDVIQIVGQN